MDTMPEELLTEIFTWCETRPYPEYDPFYPRTIPILNVCRSWRRIALSTPSLWCSLDIQYDLEYLIDEPLDLPHFLKLSKRMPLDVSLEYNRGRSMYPDWDPLDYLLSEMYRMRSIVAKYPVSISSILRLMNNLDVSESLISLELNSIDHLDLPGERKRICLRRLRNLELHSHFDSDSLPYMSLPALETLLIWETHMEFEWIHPLVCSASQTLRQITFQSSVVLSLPPEEHIKIVPSFPSLTAFSLWTDNFGKSRLPFITYTTFLIQNIAPPHNLHFRGSPNIFLDIARSMTAMSLTLDLEIHPDIGQGNLSLASIEDEENVRRFLKRFPALRELKGSLRCYPSDYRLGTKLGERDPFLKVFEDLKGSNS